MLLQAYLRDFRTGRRPASLPISPISFFIKALEKQKKNYQKAGKGTQGPALVIS